MRTEILRYEGRYAIGHTLTLESKGGIQQFVVTDFNIRSGRIMNEIEIVHDEYGLQHALDTYNERKGQTIVREFSIDYPEFA